MARKTKTPKRSRRTSKSRTKKDSIAVEILDQIVSGRLSPGGQLPLRTEMQTKYRAGPMTVQRALDRLIRDGFVEARRGHGTHVVSHPPHLFQYALVFPNNPGSIEGWPRFWTALSSEAASISQAGPQKIITYHGIAVPEKSGDYAALLNDVAWQRLAGVIFPFWPGYLKGTPLLDDPGIPMAAIDEGEDRGGIRSIAFDRRSFIDKALDYLAGRGRKRIATITVPGMGPELLAYLDRGITERGMSTRPYWCIRLAETSSYSARDVAHLLMQQSNATERPDGLVIADDNLVEGVCSGLVDAGVKVPGELEVLAHCNFPWPVPSVVPLKRLGFDARTALERCMKAIDGQRRRARQVKIAPMEAVFEDELHADGSERRAEPGTGIAFSYQSNGASGARGERS